VLYSQWICDIQFAEFGGRLLLNYISIEKFADNVINNNEGYDRETLIQTLQETLEAKNNGAVCMICGEPIWVAGSAITGSYMCFSCTTGESDDSDDYEIQ
jgi:hypothetical protein